MIQQKEFLVVRMKYGLFVPSKLPGPVLERKMYMIPAGF